MTLLQFEYLLNLISKNIDMKKKSFGLELQ